MLTVFEAYSYIYALPNLSILGNLLQCHRPAILRPGEYQDTSGIEYVFVPGDSESEQNHEPDDMGFVHARRFAPNDPKHRVQTDF